jgi:serine/threonine-protein kinase
MPDDPLSRLRDTLRRSRTGHLSTPRELEEELRALASGEYGDLLSRWDKARSQGTTLSLADLCAGRPECASTVAELIRLVEEARAGLTASGTGSTVSAPGDAPPVPLPRVPGYEVLAVLGHGGMGVVYQARQLGFNRLVALKMIRAGAAAEPGDRARFRIEAEAVARLRHPNIVQVFDIGEVAGCPYFSMEHLDGGSLARQAEAEPLPPRRAAEVVEALGRAMQHAHEADVVHRDLKPSNVLLDSDGTPKVADFGLARLLDADITRTASEVILGTACYMSPEQASGAGCVVGPAVDIYGLGAILYDLLTGRPPIERGSWATMLERVRTQEPIEPRRLRPEIDRDLESVCLKCLRKDPARRYASAQELADDLRRFLDGKPTVARPLGRVGRIGRWARRHPFTTAAALLLALAVAAVPFVVHYRDPERVPKDNLTRLERHQSVSLLGDNGAPRWSRELLGKAVAEKSGDGGEFTIDTTDRYLLELMPRMPAGGFILTAEVRHNEDLQNARVGLYFGYATRDTAAGMEHTWATLSFNDFDVQRPEGHEPTTRAVLRGERCRPPALYDMKAPPTCTVSVPAHVSRLPPMPWRTLKVRVTPADVQVWCSERTAPPKPWEALQDDFRELNALLAARGEPAVLPEFGPGGGVGLFVVRASASFRRIVIQPL